MRSSKWRPIWRGHWRSKISTSREIRHTSAGVVIVLNRADEHTSGNGRRHHFMSISPCKPINRKFIRLSSPPYAKTRAPKCNSPRSERKRNNFARNSTQRIRALATVLTAEQVQALTLERQQLL